MFTLYKKRELSDNLGDSVVFFKNFGKHFFKNYFIVNGVLLLAFGVMMYLFLRMNFETNGSVDFGRAHVGNDNIDDFLPYFNNNEMLLGCCMAVFFILIIAISLFNYAYPILYLKLVSQKNNANFTLNDIFSSFRQNIWKLLKFTIGCIVIILPIVMIILIVFFFLCFVIIGIPLLIIAIPTLFTFLNLSFYTYLTENKRFFESLNHAYILIKGDFINTIGTTLIVMFMIQMIQMSITMFFYFVGISALITSQITSQTNTTLSPFIFVLIAFAFVLIFAFSSIFSNVLVINQGILYYSLESKNRALNTDIDLIGNDNE